MEHTKETLLRRIPKMDEVLTRPQVIQLGAGLPRNRLTTALRGVLEELRQGILTGEITALPDDTRLKDDIASRLERDSRPSLRAVINATGVPLHTNFGRAPLAEEAVAAVTAAARGYSNLEYDIESGCRGSRHIHVAELLRQLTGAEDALVVNNNAAAVLLALTALAAGGEVVISRGELVEIGGAFRVPQVMEQSGAILREVGTTNKTRLSDYAAAIEENTTALLKVHTSNFKIIGFTENADLADLARLAAERGLPLIHDLGSGCICSPALIGTPEEPTVRQSVAAGAHITTFSGDKLLGGPQAGILVGKATLIAAIKSHPLVRALRIDKLTLAALEATLRLHLDAETAEDIPVISMLSATPQRLQTKAEALLTMLDGIHAEIAIETDWGQVGGGSAPGVLLEGRVVTVRPRGLSLQRLEHRLRKAPVPIIARIGNERLVLDVRTLAEEDFCAIASALREALA